MTTVDINRGDRVTLEDPDTSNQFTEIQPVFAGQEMSKEGGTQTIEILLKFPCLVA
jgi:hypothetical protein